MWTKHFDLSLSCSHWNHLLSVLKYINVIVYWDNLITYLAKIMQQFLLFQLLKTTSKVSSSFPLSALQTHLQGSQHTHTLTKRTHCNSITCIWLVFGREEEITAFSNTHTLAHMHVHTWINTKHTHCPLITMATVKRRKGNERHSQALKRSASLNRDGY